MDKMLQWTLRLGQNVTVDVVNLDVTSRQRWTNSALWPWPWSLLLGTTLSLIPHCLWLCCVWFPTVIDFVELNLHCQCLCWVWLCTFSDDTEFDSIPCQRLGCVWLRTHMTCTTVRWVKLRCVWDKKETENMYFRDIQLQFTKIYFKLSI
jgi:hypothetical protein